MTTALQGDVLVRVWDPHVTVEGARFAAVTVRQDVAVRVADDATPDSIINDRKLPGLVVITPAGAGIQQNAADVTIRAISDHFATLSILATPELLWHPVNVALDRLVNCWRIECIPFIEYMRFRFGSVDPELKATQDGR